MGLLNFSLKNHDLEHLCNWILEYEEIFNEFLEIIKENPDWVEENTNCIVSSSMLLKIIKSSLDNKKYSYLLISIVDVVDDSCINEQVFEMLIYFPDTDIRGILQVSLAHKKLTENQLVLLCQEETTFECFFELASLYYEDSIYDIEKLKAFIENFRKCKYSYMIENLLTELVDYYEASTIEKYKFIAGLLTEHDTF